MTFVVPFDGSDLAEVALVRAWEYGEAMDVDVVAISIISERKKYARRKGWIDEDEELDVDMVAKRLRDRVESLTPGVTFEYDVIREFPPAEGIAGRIERMALEYDPSLLFLGTDNIGRVATPLTSVGNFAGAAESYDIQLVRHRRPPSIEFLEPHPDFYG